MSKEKILIAGGSGLVGSFLSDYLTRQGYEVSLLGRNKKADISYQQYTWDLNSMTIDQEAISSADYIINLAGAGIADQRWTKERKRTIIDSRVKGNELIRKAIEKTNAKPKAFIAASAVGIYGDRDDERLTEQSEKGTSGFMVECCELWEASSKSIADLGIRTVVFRSGIVLSTRGGALEKILLAFKFGLGTYFGDGKQYYSWIHIEDLAEMILYAIRNPQVAGIYNAVAPEPITNKEFTLGIKEALGSKAVVASAPAFVLKTALGEMANTVLNSNRVIPARFLESDFKYLFPQLKDAIKDVVKRKV